MISSMKYSAWPSVDRTTLRVEHVDHSSFGMSEAVVGRLAYRMSSTVWLATGLVDSLHILSEQHSFGGHLPSPFSEWYPSDLAI